MISQSATIKRAIALGEILDAEACAGMLHAEFRDPVNNHTITVESTLHGAEIQPIALYLSRSPDTFVPASELLTEQDQRRLSTRLSDHLAAQNQDTQPSFYLAETVINDAMLVKNWWQ